MQLKQWLPDNAHPSLSTQAIGGCGRHGSGFKMADRRYPRTSVRSSEQFVVDVRVSNGLASIREDLD